MVTLRPATRADLPFVYAALCDLEETTLDERAFAAVYEANLGNPTRTSWYVIAEREHVPVGFASCHVQWLLHHVGAVAEIQELYILPDYRSRGVGQQLVTYFIELAKAEGWVNLEVTANRRRERTHVFYERMGFRWTSLKFVKGVIF